MKNLRWIVLSLLLSGAALIGLFALTFTPETRAYLGQVSIAPSSSPSGFRPQRTSADCRGSGSSARVLAHRIILGSHACFIPFALRRRHHPRPDWWRTGPNPSPLDLRARRGDATTVVVVERVLDLVVFFSLTFTVLLSLRSLWGYLAATVLYPVAAFLILALTLVLLLGILIRHPSLMKQVVGSISTLILDRCGQSQRWSRFCPGIGDARSL